MFGLGFTEILVIFVVALLVLGPEKLPQMARQLAKTLGELRRTADEIRRNFDEAGIEPEIQQAWQKTLAAAQKATSEQLAEVGHEPSDLASKAVDGHQDDDREATAVLADAGLHEPVDSSEPTSKILLESMSEGSNQSAPSSTSTSEDNASKGSNHHGK